MMVRILLNIPNGGSRVKSGRHGKSEAAKAKLQIGKFTPVEGGRVNMYLNYAQEHWTHMDGNSPINLNPEVRTLRIVPSI